MVYPDRGRPSAVKINTVLTWLRGGRSRQAEPHLTGFRVDDVSSTGPSADAKRAGRCQGLGGERPGR